MSSEPAPTTALTDVVAAGTLRRPPLPRRLRPAVILAIAAGGALGGVARYEIDLAHPTPPGTFPSGIWAINVSGSFLLAVVVTLVVERWPPGRYVRPFVGVGFCGGYTTWSTVMADTVLLVRDHHAPTAVAYLAASLAAGLAATVGGIWLARLRPRRARGRPS